MPSRDSQRRSPEDRKRLRERLLIFLTLFLVLALTGVEIFLVRRGGYPMTGSLLAFGLLNLNAILFLLFTFLIFRHLSKLFVERRQKVFGSRLRTRLILTFITLSLLPTLIMFFIAWQLIASRADFRGVDQMQETLDQALTLGRTFIQGLEDKLRATGLMVQRELEGEAALAPSRRPALAVRLATLRQLYHLSVLAVVAPDGSRVAASFEPEGEMPLPPQAGDIPAAGHAHRQTVARGTLLSFTLPLRAPGAAPGLALVVGQILPRALLNQLTEMSRQENEARQIQLLIQPVRVSHYLTLVVVTLLTLMAAIWLAFYMAREITTPIRQLAEGTLKVAGGDYDFHIEQEGRDEIGFLVQSFNKMTQDLQLSQRQLAATYEALRQSHSELLASQRHLEILVRNVAAGVIAVDAAGRITGVNDSAARMLGVKWPDVLNQEIQAVLPVTEHRRLEEAMAATRRSRGTVETHIHLILPDRVRYLLFKTTVLKDDQGEDHGLVMVIEDLTELERAQRLEAWREVARRIAHEVKNPLTPIKLAAQRLRRRYLGHIPDDSQVFEECTRIISDQVDEIKNLVNQFSQFARLPHLALAPHDLNALIQETLSLYQEVQPRVTLDFRPASGLPPVLVDQEQIKRLLLNLVDNALAAIPGPGAITVTLAEEDEGGAVRLEVADTGTGISDRDKERIFEPYFSTKRGGTGLGLAIVHSIVADHQGRIQVADNHPAGTRFIINLPTHRGHHAGNHTRSG